MCRARPCANGGAGDAAADVLLVRAAGEGQADVTAVFELQRLHEPIVVLTPETPEERILLAAFLRYDANQFSVSVDRFENGHIERVRLSANHGA